MTTPARHAYGTVVCNGSDRRLLTDGAANAFVDYDGACDLAEVGVLVMRARDADPGSREAPGYVVTLGGPLIRRDGGSYYERECERLDVVYVLDRDRVAKLVGELIDGAYRAGGPVELDYVLAVMQQTCELAEQEREQQAQASR